jgi:hypothetical protein
MLVCPHEILQNHPLGIEGMKVQNNSWRRSRRFLRVAASSNKALHRKKPAFASLRQVFSGELERWAAL